MEIATLEVPPLPARRSPVSALVVVLCLLFAVLVAIGVRAYLNWPLRDASRYLLVMYDGPRAPQAVRYQILSRAFDRVTVRITARFGIDPDYGTNQGSPPWPEYTSQVEMVRRGLSWIPSNGLTAGDESFAYLNWAATDPMQERIRSLPAPCG